MRFIQFHFFLCLFASAACGATIGTVLIGNAGNAASQTGYGAVPYAFGIGRTEVTNDQYVAFLSSVAADDPKGLFNVQMASTTVGGSVRSGSPGSYTYAVKAAVGNYSYGNKPVVWVTYYDSMRFANWLHNGQPVGSENSSTTEDGAYNLSLGSNAVRKAGALAWLPSENEWYKAAYYNPVTATYDLYATRSSLTPNNHAPATDSGNSANYYNNGWATGSQSYPLTDAGAYTLSASRYGTYDQAGGVWEWTDSLVGSERIMRGGSWNDNQGGLSASYRQFYNVSFDNEHVGIRVAVAAAPEPGVLSLALVGISGLLLSRRCRPVV